jgi:hypothetical protein
MCPEKRDLNVRHHRGFEKQGRWSRSCTHAINTDGLHEVFPYVSLSALYETVTVRLLYRQMCARWVKSERNS